MQQWLSTSESRLCFASGTSLPPELARSLSRRRHAGFATPISTRLTEIGR